MATWFLSLILTVGFVLKVTDGQALGFVLNGVNYPNGSTVLRTDIGEGDAALNCTTDSTTCCTKDNGEMRAGEFYFPDGSKVLTMGSAPMNSYYRTRSSRLISLHRRPNATQTGQFRCEIPNASGTLVNLFINIVNELPTTPPTPPPVTTPPATRATTIAQPVTTAETAATTAPDSTIEPTTQPGPVSISVSIAASGTNVAGETYSLECSATVTGSTDQPTVTWLNSGAQIMSDATRMVSATTMNPGDGGYSSTLTFNPLAASHAGTYTCRVTAGGATETQTSTVIVNVPAPTSVTVTNSPVNVGSTLTLTCTVELSPAVDVPVTVNTVWTGTDGFRISNTAQQMGNSDTYISTTTVTNEYSGDYTCTATVTSTSTFINSSVGTPSSPLRIIIGVYLSLKGVVYPNNSFILITEIGQTDTTSNNGLQCITDLNPCCASTDVANRHGEWYFPDNGGVVPRPDLDERFSRTRGVNGEVNLNRLNNDVMMPTGRFCCVVPDAMSTEVTLCTNVVLELPTNLPPLTSSTTLAAPGTGPEQPTTASSSSSTPTVQPQSSGPGAGVIAGVIIIVLILVAVVIIIVIVALLFFRRRKSEKLLTDTPTKARPTSIKTRPAPPIAYSKTHNGDKVSGVGRKLDAKILKFPSDMTITEGEGVYFKIKVSGVPQPTVTWYHDGEPVKADYAREVEEDGSLAIPSTELKHSGVYKAVVANQHGSEEREVKLTVSEEGGARRAVQGDIVSTRPIPIPEFGKYTAELHANSNQPFRDLFQALDDGENGHTTDYANDPERKLLNRFGNIVVYDDNRIPLQPIPDTPDCQEDYINACYVDGYSLPNKFIATQGPLPKTVVDFWRLIWQERPPTIVMVTNVKEGNRIKCQQYWPESGKKEFGPFQVIITDQQVFADYTVRTLSVSLGSGRSHKVTQYHFTAWPDHGVPDYATPILAFHRRVKAQHHPSRGPMLVHCSAGVGRTGTFIVIDNILEQIEKEQVVDIPGAITKIRQKRMKMVQSLEQFAFIHDAILESVTCGDTQISATNLRVAITKMKKKDPLNQLNAFQHQFKILEQVTPKPEEVQSSQAQSFPDRNRGALYLPANRWRVILKGEHPDYIHAVNINGYKQHKAFIIAQGPMDSTVRNFWKMIFDRKCAVIVMVSGLVERGEESSTQYWPSSGTYQYGEYTVDLLGEEPLEGFTIRDLSVIDNESEKAHKVTQFHITCWTADGRCSNLRSITDVIEEITKVQIRSGNKPIVVHCNDTVTRSGMFCAIATTIERCKTEGVVDVFQVVKALRVQKPGAVPTVDQYKVIFDSVLVFLESFDTYANFQNI